MPLTLAAMFALAQICAPTVAPETLLSVARVESGFEPLAIGVNGGLPRSLRPKTNTAAVRQASELIASGVSVDLGVGQINSRNLSWLGLKVEDAFDPCRNLEAAAKVLVANYHGAARDREPQAALRTALSMYNTGDRSRGFRNGYVGKVTRAAAYVVPALQTASPALTPKDPRPSSGAPAATAAPWDVFGRRASPVMVFSTPEITTSDFTPNISGDRHEP